MKRLGSAVLGAALAAGAWQAAAAATDEALLAAARREQPALLHTLQRLVGIDSGSGDAAGLAALTTLLETELQAAGARVTRQRRAGAADALVARVAGRGGRNLLLIAHLDTVYPPGTLAAAPFRDDGERAWGPGICDDKGGVALVLHTLRLLRATGRQDFGTLTVLFNADEERGSPGSHALVTALAREHDAVLSFEPSADGRERLPLGTSGVAHVRAVVQGRAAHAGAAPALGVNALVEAADFVLRTQDLDDPARGLRLAWTVAQAGGAENVIPATAVLHGDLRYARREDLDGALRALEARARATRLPGARVTLQVERGRPPFDAGPRSRALAERAIAIYREAGGRLEPEARSGGGTDAAYAALADVPVLEGLGLPGAGVHGSGADESIALDAIPRRLYLVVRLVDELGRGAPLSASRSRAGP